MLLTAIKKNIAGDIVMTSRLLVFTTELTTAGIQENDINVPAMQYMVYFILSSEVHGIFFCPNAVHGMINI